MTKEGLKFLAALGIFSTSFLISRCMTGCREDEVSRYNFNRIDEENRKIIYKYDSNKNLNLEPHELANLLKNYRLEKAK